MENVKDFVQSAYRRVQIATVFRVIHCTPLGKDPENYARELQTRLKLQWYRMQSYNDESSNTRKLWQEHIDQQILQQHQHALACRVHGVIPSEKVEQAFECEDFNWSDDDNSITKDILNTTAEKENAPCENNHVQANIDFIRSVIHLNALCSMCITVPTSEVNCLLNRLPFSKDLHKSSGMTSLDDGFFSHGTGLTSDYLSLSCSVSLHLIKPTTSALKTRKKLAGVMLRTDSSSFKFALMSLFCGSRYSGQPPSESERKRSRLDVAGISSSVLQYVLRSSDGDQLVEKSVQAILNQLAELASKIQTSSDVYNLINVSRNWTVSDNASQLSTLA